MAILAPPNEIVKIVKTRQTYRLQMVIVTCDRNGRCWYEGAPKISGFDIVGVVRYLRANWPTKDGKRVRVMLVAHNPMRCLFDLEKAFGDDPEWNARISVTEGDREDTEECTLWRAERQRLTYCGFRDSRRHTRYFYPISPLEFMGDINEYGTDEESETVTLYRFGGNVRSFLKKNGLRFSASKGGISAQLLKDSKFYPSDRRKVPTLTNEAARPALPGNCYQMTERNLSRFIQSVYVIDQENAHHYAAETVPLPAADTLFAYGWYFNQDDAEWLNYRDSLYQEALKEYGLFRVCATVPQRLSGYLPPWARLQTGAQNGGSITGHIWLFSNEFALAESLGVQIRYVSRWYSSKHRDEGLSAYARWSQDTVIGNPTQRGWLKPTLLSAYGILGAKPRHMESGYKQCDKGEPHTYILSGRPFTFHQVKTKRKIQSPVANVVQRGIIEAETRRLSIELARQFETEGHNVVGVHADAILVEDKGQQLPLLPPPWRVKDRLSRFKAIDAVSFVSDELEILPGRPHAKR